MQNMMQKNDNPAGFIMINKPKGITSHDVVDKLRGITGIRKIGHAGTLDPAATGLLILGIGKATKQLKQLVGLDKEYEAEIELGKTSDTYDSDGIVETFVKDTVKDTRCRVPDIECPPQEKIQQTIKQFIGPQDQIPPMYSARKVKGKKLYELARQGLEVERPAKRITIHNIELLSYEFPILKIKVKCSSGTYIRSIAHDLGQALGCGAYLKGLIRTSIDKYQLSDAQEIKDLTKDNWQEYLFSLPPLS